MEKYDEDEEPKNYPKCFGTKEVNPRQGICKSCEHIEDCVKLRERELSTHIIEALKSEKEHLHSTRIL